MSTNNGKKNFSNTTRIISTKKTTATKKSRKSDEDSDSPTITSPILSIKRASSCNIQDISPPSAPKKGKRPVASEMTTDVLVKHVLEFYEKKQKEKRNVFSFNAETVAISSKFSFMTVKLPIEDAILLFYGSVTEDPKMFELFNCDMDRFKSPTTTGYFPWGSFATVQDSDGPRVQLKIKVDAGSVEEYFKNLENATSTYGYSTGVQVKLSCKATPYVFEDVSNKRTVWGLSMKLIKPVVVLEQEEFDNAHTSFINGGEAPGNVLEALDEEESEYGGSLFDFAK